MKTTVKIFILLAAIVAVFILVMLFLHELSTAPSIPNYDVYESELSQYLDNFKRYKILEEANAPFQSNIRCAEIFYKEKKISANRCDDFIDKMMNEYVRIFRGKWSEMRFKSPWNENDILEMRKRVNMIEAVKYTDGKSACKDYQSELDKLKAISKKYWEAVGVCRKYGFYTIRGAEETVNTIKTYRNNVYLKNCGKLVADLDKAIESLNSSHFKCVEEKVESLERCVKGGAFKSMKKSDFETRYLKPANDAVAEYSSNAIRLYGKDSGSSNLTAKIKKLKGDADNYYNTLGSGTSSGSSSGASSGASSGSSSGVSSETSSGRSSGTSSGKATGNSFEKIEWGKTYKVSVGNTIYVFIDKDMTWQCGDGSICTLKRDGDHVRVTGISKGRAEVKVYKKSVLKGTFWVETQ